MKLILLLYLVFIGNVIGGEDTGLGMHYHDDVYEYPGAFGKDPGYTNTKVVTAGYTVGDDSHVKDIEDPSLGPAVDLDYDPISSQVVSKPLERYPSQYRVPYIPSHHHQLTPESYGHGYYRKPVALKQGPALLKHGIGGLKHSTSLVKGGVGALKSGPAVFSDGHGIFPDDPVEFKGVSEEFHDHPAAFKDIHGLYKGGSGVFKDGPRVFKGGPGAFKDGPGVFRGLSEGFHDHPAAFKDIHGLYKGGPGVFKDGPGPGIYQDGPGIYDDGPGGLYDRPGLLKYGAGLLKQSLGGLFKDDGWKPIIKKPIHHFHHHHPIHPPPPVPIKNLIAKPLLPLAAPLAKSHFFSPTGLHKTPISAGTATVVYKSPSIPGGALAYQTPIATGLPKDIIKVEKHVHQVEQYQVPDNFGEYGGHHHPIDVKPILPLYHRPTPFAVQPSLSYGYSYKLVPTYAYGPAIVDDHKFNGHLPHYNHHPYAQGFAHY